MITAEEEKYIFSSVYVAEHIVSLMIPQVSFLLDLSSTWDWG
jgi:hypothetical protein